jgi:hypothetical protein
MISVSPIESDSDDGGDRIFPFSSEDSRTMLVPHDIRADRDREAGIESGPVTGPSGSVVQGLGEVKRERESRMVPSLLYPPVKTFDGDPSGWRKVSRISISLCRIAPMLNDIDPVLSFPFHRV